MEGKIIKKTVPNVPLVREKPKEEILEGEIGDELEEIKEDRPEQLRAGRRNLKKKNFSKTEKTEQKKDGSIVTTIIEINGNTKKTTVITKKGNSTSTNTQIETIYKNESGNTNYYNNNNNNYNNNQNTQNYNYNSDPSNWNFGSIEDFNKMWSNQIKQMNNNPRNINWGYDWNSNKNNKNINNNKVNINNNQQKKEIISGNSFQKEALDTHNNYRKKHHANNLVLNKDLCNIAQKYAEYLAKTGNFEHSSNSYNGNPLGENLFACYGIKINGKMMTDDWYNEIKQYNFNKPGFISGTGHFTQIIWKDSKEVGFGYAQGSDGYYYGVANYYPAGNYMGEFEYNVLRA